MYYYFIHIPTAELEPLEIDPITIRFGQQLGEGQFGKVLEGVCTVIPGRDKQKPVTVAIKFLSGDQDQSARETFIKEAHRLARLPHPHIVALLGVCFKETPSFIVMELMSRGDLKEMLTTTREKHMSLPPLQQIIIAKQIASALMFLATIPFVHRDIAARNVLIAEDDVYKLGDFGALVVIYMG